MLITCNGESPQSKMIDHIIRGGNIPSHLMDIPMGNLSCNHQYESWEDYSFYGVVCKTCGRSAILEEYERYMMTDFVAFENEFNILLKREV